MTSPEERLSVLSNHICRQESDREIRHITMSGGTVVPPLTTHVLDTAKGRPASGINMVLSVQDKGGNWQEVERGATNNDGRGGFLSSGSGSWKAAVYKLHFDTGPYFTANCVKGFYPYIEVVFQIEDPTQHYHVPILLSPFGYSTYRGS